MDLLIISIGVIAVGLCLAAIGALLLKDRDRQPKELLQKINSIVGHATSVTLAGAVTLLT